MSEHPADSAGVPFGGRTLTGTGFDADTGEADPQLLAALAGPADDVRLVRAVAAARLLVPIVAEHSDMAAVTLVAPDGQQALPVFTSLLAVRAWDPDARPVPVTAARAAQAAVSERCDVMVLDVGGQRPTVLRSSMVWALAQQREWLPAHEDPHVARAVADAVASQPAIVGHELAAGESGTGILRVVLRLSPGLDAASVQQVAAAVGERLATDGETRARIDGLAFTIR